MYHDYEVIKPVGMSNAVWNKRMHDFFTTEVPKRVIEIKERVARSSQTKRLLERINNMLNPTFVTLTLNEEYINKPNNVIIRAFRERLQREFGQQIKWVLVSDYGSTTGRLHFHGFIDVEENKLIDVWNLKYKGHKKFYSVYANYDFFIGGISINKGYQDQFEKAVYYCTKYITKDGANTKHRVYGSRVGTLSMTEVASEVFGCAVVVEG